MNCGLVDACVLGQLLSDVIRGKRPESELDCYEQLRRPAAAEVLALAGRLTALATMRGAFRRTIRNAVFSILDRIAPVKHRLLMNLSGLGRRHLSRAAAAPRRCGGNGATRRPRSRPPGGGDAPQARSVVGSMVLRTSVILVAGNPLISACRAITASSFAR